MKGFICKESSDSGFKSPLNLYILSGRDEVAPVDIKTAELTADLQVQYLPRQIF